MFSKWFKRPQTLEALREHATDGITTWLTGFAPGLVPERPDPVADDPSAAGWIHWFVRDVITTNPISRSPLSSVQIYLLEQALGCVDWPRSPATGGSGTWTGRGLAWSTLEQFVRLLGYRALSRDRSRSLSEGVL